jgi:hypothetical protein
MLWHLPREPRFERSAPRLQCRGASKPARLQCAHHGHSATDAGIPEADVVSGWMMGFRSARSIIGPIVRRRAAGRISGYPLGEQLQASGHALVLDSDPAEGGWDPRGVRHVMRLTEPPFRSFTPGRRPLQGSRSQFDGRGGHAFGIEGLGACGAQKSARLNAGRRLPTVRARHPLRGPRIRDTEYIKIVPERGSDGTTERQRRRAGC